LHHALAGKQLALYYQPQIFLSSGRIAGCEALMRWKHPEVGFISPAEFIPVAEENGFICEMGAWALRAACTQGRLWEKAGLSSRVAVNLSTRQIASGGIVALVVEVLEETGLTPSLLELEITESIAMSDIEYVIETLLALKKLGVTIAMDDFGTGYSSLSYLKRLPLDILKVDQSFIRNLTVDAGDAAITRTVVAMAHSFGMQVVAEGVETIEQRDWLRELGCEVAQGYLYAKPLPADEATVFLRTHLPLPSMMKERAMEIMPESARHGLSHRVF
jgi:EAL domain-containing protein (putative c-di-GMP-specific phosphodiesterase class I)